MAQPDIPAAPSAQYQWAVEFLDKRVDFERFQTMPGPGRELKLDRMRALLDRLGNPQDKLRIVHVAGTKGKGSTSAMIAAVLQAAGYRTGLFTSPHLEKIEERIAIDGQPCTADQFAELAAAVRPAVEALDQEAEAAGSGEHGPTYFEIITAMALLCFVRHRVQAAVLEVGLGGRLDSTNVCRPLVSVITSISFDHVQQLGHTLEAIAREKAGIIKPGVPVISGVTAEEPRTVIRRIARESNCRLAELDEDFRFEYQPPQHLEGQAALGSVMFWEVSANKASLPLVEGRGEGCDLPLALLGRHQAANAAIALATIHELIRQGWNISEQAICQGFLTVRWPAPSRLSPGNPL